ncbi:hypothetical protein BDV30DRAFT_210415 [Aspergillus minisclerotigenes]|uniref:Uncharacterized protein n=1 Tax=Aspergillus minisclerotigenes TaxID=656917 RepID=A0A5N6J5L0_9EURO|nr:hypothetical protein BDV30DRAFT_210415 [Aspergillus minisclerotigenes]
MTCSVFNLVTTLTSGLFPFNFCPGKADGGRTVGFQGREAGGGSLEGGEGMDYSAKNPAPEITVGSSMEWSRKYKGTTLVKVHILRC